MTNRRSDLSVERTNQILDSAALVFARHGFHQARMDDIVRESGLSKGSIYWYFKSKDEIIFALMQRFFDAELNDLRALLEEDSPAGERLLRFTRRVADDVTQIQAAGLLPLFYEFYAHATREGTVREFMQEYFRSFRATLIPLIQNGVERGEFRSLDPEQVVITCFALYEGLILAWTIDPQAIDLHDQASMSMHLLLKGLTVHS